MKRDDHTLLADPTVELIKSYTFASRRIEHDRKELTAEHWSRECSLNGGCNPLTRELTPMKFAAASMEVDAALDHITAAVEAGVVDNNSWATQLFASAGDLEGFLDLLSSYDDCHRITDRWWYALQQLARTINEEGFVRCEDIVERLRESIDEGAKRREVLRLQAQYFARQPLVNIKLTDKQRMALDDHNDAVRTEALKKGAKEDVSINFAFQHRILYLNGKALAARQVTHEDLAALACGKFARVSDTGHGAKSRPGKRPTRNA